MDKLERTSSRIEITKILADLFKESETEEIDKTVYLLLGSLAPGYQGIVFNVAERMMLQVVVNAYQKDLGEVKKIYKRVGDVGDTAYKLAVKGNKTKSLSVGQVYESLFKIAQDEGTGSQERKINDLAGLFSQLDPLSVKFVARIPIGRLRLGFSDKTVLDALSWMEKGDKSVKSDLDQAYQVLPDVGLLAKKVKQFGVKKATEKVMPQVGVPVLPMLAQRLKSPTEMISKMGTVVVEPKLDGLRIQIHFKSGKRGFTKAYTRNLNENSWMFPELKQIGKQIRAKEVILDTEAIGVDEKRQKLANFQATMTRRRKHQIEEFSSKVPIKFYVFDCLYKDGTSYMDKDYLKRRKVLEGVVNDGKLIEKVKYLKTNSPKEIETLNFEKTKEGLEGIMVKKADGNYVPGRTGWRWVKMKEAEKALGKVADTIDCVVMGYSTGRGKRVGFGIGQFFGRD